MNFGPRKIVISIAAIPAIRTSPRSIALEAISPISTLAVSKLSLRRPGAEPLGERSPARPSASP